MVRRAMGGILPGRADGWVRGSPGARVGRVIRTINDLDLRSVLADLDDQHDLNQQIEAAVTGAVKESLAARLRDLL